MCWLNSPVDHEGSLIVRNHGACRSLSKNVLQHSVCGPVDEIHPDRQSRLLFSWFSPYNSFKSTHSKYPHTRSPVFLFPGQMLKFTLRSGVISGMMPPPQDTCAISPSVPMATWLQLYNYSCFPSLALSWVKTDNEAHLMAWCVITQNAGISIKNKSEFDSRCFF